LRPNPLEAMHAMFARHLPARPAQGRWLAPREAVVDLSNHVTEALRTDLPTQDRRDSAVVWETWRQVVLRVRDFLKSLSPDEEPMVAWLTHHFENVADYLALALNHPGELARHYCPWANDFFTQERLYPESPR